MGVMMGSIMFATGVFITTFFITTFICIHAVKNDNWIYGRDYKKYARQGIIDWTCLLPCFFKPISRVKVRIDREKEARERAKEARVKKFEEKALAEVSKQTFGLEDMQRALELQMANRRKKEMAELGNVKKDGATILRDIYVRIVKADGLRADDWNGKTDPVVLAEIDGKPESRIITPTVLNTTTPKWYFQQLLQGYELGDKIKITVWDDDPGSSQPEDGDYLGRCEISSEEFYPKGMAQTDFLLFEKDDSVGDVPIVGGV